VLLVKPDWVVPFAEVLLADSAVEVTVREAACSVFDNHPAVRVAVCSAADNRAAEGKKCSGSDAVRKLNLSNATETGSEMKAASGEGISFPEAASSIFVFLDGAFLSKL